MDEPDASAAPEPDFLGDAIEERDEAAVPAPVVEKGSAWEGVLNRYATGRVSRPLAYSNSRNSLLINYFLSVICD